VKRRPDGSGHTRFTIPDWRSECISAFEAVIICLAGMEDGSTPLRDSDSDVAMASRYAEVSALHGSPEERADEVIDVMIRGRRRAAELVKESRFIRIREALERALDCRSELTALQVCEVLAEAEKREGERMRY
jgi:hypothetical protein